MKFIKICKEIANFIQQMWKVLPVLIVERASNPGFDLIMVCSHISDEWECR